MSSKLVILKIGGSVLNPKSSFSKINREALFKVGRELAKLRREYGFNFIIIHGGGGLAHTAVKILRPTEQRGDLLSGASLTKLMLLYLKLELCRILYRSGLPVYPLDTEAIVAEVKPDLKVNVSKLSTLISAGLVPVLNGDLELWNSESTIISGDYLAYAICRDMRPAACIFLIDKKGILDKNERTVQTLREEDIKSLIVHNVSTVDVTGGILSKIEYCFKIAKLGVKTFVCSGFHPESISEVIFQGCSDKCTRVEA